MPNTMKSLLFDAYIVALGCGLRCPGHRFRLSFLRQVARIDIASTSSVERNVRLTTKGGISIGHNTNINRHVVLDGRGGLSIGDHVNISPEVQILTADHDPRAAAFEGRVRAVSIGDRVWLATRSMILPGAHIGDGAVVAAGAVVRGEVAPGAVVAGNPAVPVAVRPDGAQVRLPRYRRFLH